MITKLPYYDTMSIGTRINAAGDCTLAPMARYVVFSRPCGFHIEVIGFSANFSNNSVQVRISNGRVNPSWTLALTPELIFAGYFTKDDPILRLPEPFIIEAGQQLQLDVSNNSTGTSNAFAKITLVGCKLVETV